MFKYNTSYTIMVFPQLGTLLFKIGAWAKIENQSIKVN